jgi:RNA-directed DNA polymerase
VTSSRRRVSVSDAIAGAAGVDRETFAAVEQYGVERMLDEVGAARRFASARIVRRRSCGDTSRTPMPAQRPLGIPTVRDRVVQMAATIVLELL